MLFLIARRIWENNFYAWCVVLLAALMPGSVYNSVVGMENGIFAFVILVWIYLAIYWKWFEMPDALPIWKEMSLGAWLGLALWLRPEGSVFFFIVLACQFFFGKMFSKSAAHNLKHGLILSAPFLIFAAGLVYFNWVHTGSLLPTSGLSRIFISARDSFWLGFFRLDPKFLMRLVYYFPLTLFWLVGNWIIFSNKKASRHSNIMVFFVLTFWIFFVLFSTVLSTAHLARYIIFISPFMIIISVVGAIWVWKNWGFIVPPKMGLYKNAAFFILIASLLLIFLLEISVRLKLDTHNSLTNMMRAPLIRKEYSDAFYVKLGKPFFSPIFIAMQEVQVRYLLDQRFVVCSLDGRVDPVLLKYVKNGNVDHLGYIKERKINFIIDIPNYNRDRTCWSLADLQFLKTGESFTKEGVSFTALPFARWWFRVIINK
jgi:hypothetical protein